MSPMKFIYGYAFPCLSGGCETAVRGAAETVSLQTLTSGEERPKSETALLAVFQRTRPVA